MIFRDYIHICISCLHLQHFTKHLKILFSFFTQSPSLFSSLSVFSFTGFMCACQNHIISYVYISLRRSISHTNYIIICYVFVIFFYFFTCYSFSFPYLSLSLFNHKIFLFSTKEYITHSIISIFI